MFHQLLHGAWPRVSVRDILWKNDKQSHVNISWWTDGCISKNIFHSGVMAQSKPSETPRWWITPARASIQLVVSYIAPRSLFHYFFAFCRSPILTIILALWPTVTIRRNGFIGYGLPSGLQCDGWHYENLSSRSIYVHAKCNSLFTNYKHHSKSPDLCGYWQSITCSVRLLPNY